uniref:hypothetical protein n=1 Tax=Cocconeiopsis kantsiensis TaxID=3082010 RepID=UPI0030020C6C
MKIKKQKKLLNIYLLKTKLYENKKTYDNINIEEMSIHIRKCAKIIYNYSRLNKKIIVIDEIKQNTKTLTALIKLNIKLDKIYFIDTIEKLNNQKLKNYILVSINNETQILNYSRKNKIPLISFSNIKHNNLYQNEYKILGNFTHNFKDKSSFNFIMSLIMPKN